MDYYELLEFLDLEEPAQFIYFEAMADLVECDEAIDQEAVYGLFNGAEKEMIAQLFEDYFEDILEGLPEDSDEIYDLLHQIKLSLMGLAMNMEEDSDVRKLTDEFCNFRNWYVYDSNVELSPETGDGEAIHHCLRDAITASRVENLGGTAYRYDFTGAMDYPLDSYDMSVAALMALEDDEENGDGHEFIH